MAKLTTNGKCDACNIVWTWATRGGPRVTRGEALCPECGTTLRRCAVGLMRGPTDIRIGVRVRGED